MARGIAEVTGYSTTAVCVIEPETTHRAGGQTDDGAVQTAVNHCVVTEEDLVGWLSAVFTKADWEPEALVLVGSAGTSTDSCHSRGALSVPVFTPAEAKLALARGAALACARNGEFGFRGDFGGAVGTATADTAGPPAARRAVRRLAQSGPRAMLAAGIVTFVVSASAALALQVAPERVAPEPRPAADTSVQTPAAVRSPAPAAPPPVLEATSPPPEAEPCPEALPIAEEVPIADAALPQPEVPALPPPPDAPPGAARRRTLPGLPAPEMVPSPCPRNVPGILDRIRERLSGIGDGQQPAAVPPPAAPLPDVTPPLLPQ